MNIIRWSAAILALWATSLTTSYAVTDKVYSIGIVPQYETHRLHSIWQPILNQLEKDTGLKFKIHGSANIPEFEKNFLSGKFDFAYMNPYHLILSLKSGGYIPLVRDHSKQLQGVLVVRNDSEITNVNQLDNQTLAFPSPNALGASLLMRAELKNKHKLNINPIYVKSHDSVYLNVALKQTAAGGGVQKTLNRQKASISDKLKVLYRTQKVAPHPFTAHKQLDSIIVNKVMQAMLRMGTNEPGRKLLSQIPINKIGPASMKDYTPLSTMGLEYFRVIK